MKYIIVFLIILYLPINAWSALGDNESSVQADKQIINGTITQSDLSTHKIYSISTEKSVLREFVTPSGTIFGFAWQGPNIPDMQQLLGSHYQDYVAAVKAERQKHRGRKPLNINYNGLVVQIRGHMRAFFVRAYLPGMVPQGVDAGTIQ